MVTDDEAQAIAAMLADYYALWNARDAAAVWERVYRLDKGARIRTLADLTAVLDALVAEGWGHSTLDSLTLSRRGGGYVAHVIYTRWTTGGEAMQPAGRPCDYAIARFGDGLRITGFA